MRKTIIYLIAAVLISACVKPYEKVYDLELDSYSYDLSYTAREFPVYVYCSTAWTAAFEPSQEWISIVDGTEKGEGVGVVKVSVQDNDEAVRTATLVITNASGKSKSIEITQKYNSDRFEITDYE